MELFGNLIFFSLSNLIVLLLFDLIVILVDFGFGFFFLCSSSLNSDTNEHVAIKKIANAFDNKVDAKRTLREIKLLRHMDHENVSE